MQNIYHCKTRENLIDALHQTLLKGWVDFEINKRGQEYIFAATFANPGEITEEFLYPIAVLDKCLLPVLRELFADTLQHHPKLGAYTKNRYMWISNTVEAVIWHEIEELKRQQFIAARVRKLLLLIEE